jgi:hypothetical protein
VPATMPRNGPGRFSTSACPGPSSPAHRLSRERVFAKKNQAPWTDPERSFPSGQTARRGIARNIPASDPVAITVEKASKGVEPNSLHSLDEPEAPPDKPDSQEAEVASILPIVGLFSANFLVLRQISYFFDWWCRLLGGRR